MSEVSRSQEMSSSMSLLGGPEGGGGVDTKKCVKVSLASISSRTRKCAEESVLTLN